MGEVLEKLKNGNAPPSFWEGRAVVRDFLTSGDFLRRAAFAKRRR